MSNYEQKRKIMIQDMVDNFNVKCDCNIYFHVDCEVEEAYLEAAIEVDDILFDQQFENPMDDPQYE